MPQPSVQRWQHSHDFSSQNVDGERRTYYVLILTAITMVVEIVAGTAYGSMALLADGWHMGTHVAAFLITIYAYRYARKHATNPAFSFGTGKVNVLGGFASAVALAVVALMMAVESLQRLFSPQAIHFNEAIIVACLGLVINLISALLLSGHHHHEHHDHQEHDHNLRAAYLHVLADALTSILAIAALLAGKFLGWGSMDPLMGIVGAVIIARWSYGLVRQSGPILLDASTSQNYRQEITKAIEANDDHAIADIHVWHLSANHYAAIISVVTTQPEGPEYFKRKLSHLIKLRHITIEVNHAI